MENRASPPSLAPYMIYDNANVRAGSPEANLDLEKGSHGL